MANIVAVTSCPTGIAHGLMAAEALRQTAPLLGHEIEVEVHAADGISNPLTSAQIAAADLVLIAADIHVETDRFAAKPIVIASTSRAIRQTEQLIRDGLASVPGLAFPPGSLAETARPDLRIVAVTACPTGIAHTFLAAEALMKAAEARGLQLKVETQGSVGTKNRLTEDEIRAADLVVIAADTYVDQSRFIGKRLFKSPVGVAVRDAASLLESAIKDARATSEAAKPPSVKSIGAQPDGVYKHLLTGVSYMLPIVVAGGLCVALSFVFGIDAFKEEGTLAAALMDIGSGAAFQLMVPVLSGFLAYSIADRPGLTPGLIGGYLAMDLGAGFIGGIVSGFIAGYTAQRMNELIRLPTHVEGLKPILVIPLLSTLVVGLAMVFVIGAPVRVIMEGLTHFLAGMGSINAVLLGLLLGGMMAIDMGGPINKAAYTFAVGLLTAQSVLPMAAVMAGGMTPPMGISLATLLGSNRFTQAEREAGKAAGILGLSFITEGAIPFAAKDPLHVIPAAVLGSAVAGALSMYFGCGLRAPHGGIFVLAIPNAMTHLPWYAVAVLAGTLVTTAALLLLKRPLTDV